MTTLILSHYANRRWEMSSGNFSDDWNVHKNDLTVWRRFWALWELRRKWKWADWFYQQLDRLNGQVLETKA